jgi:hypothetical protein
VKRRSLQHGDRVRIGDSLFLFLLYESDVPPESSEVQFNDRGLTSDSTVQFGFNDAVYVMARDLATLMKVSTTINAIRGLVELQKTLLELMFEVVPANRAAILLAESSEKQEEEEFSSVFALDRIKGPDTTIEVSRTVARQVLRDGTALLISDRYNKATPEQQVMLDSPTSSLLCVPLTITGRSSGRSLRFRSPAVGVGGSRHSCGRD